MSTIEFGFVLGATVKGLGAITSLSRKINTIDTCVNKLNKKLNFQSSFAKSSIGATRLNKKIQILSKTSKTLKKNLDLQNKIKNYRNNFRSSFMDKVALGATVIAPLKIAIDFESAMADVKKVVNFDNNKELKLFENEISKLSTTIPIAADGLAAITAAGGRLGIAKDKLLDFTKITAKMSTAFDMLPDQAGDASAKLMNVFKLSIAGVSSLGDAINHLSDNSASKANELVNVLGRVGGNAQLLNLSAKQTASLANSFLALGKPPEIAATAINSMLLKLGTADKQGTKFQGALKEIGLSAKQLKANIKKDGEGAIVDFLEKVKGIDKDKRLGVLSDMFGANFADDIALLVGGLDNYHKAIDLVADKQKYQGSMDREFQARSKTTANNLILLKNSANRVAINFGTVLLPAINSVIAPFKAWTNTLGDWVAKNPATSKLIGGVAAGFVGMSLAISGVAYVGSFLLGGLSKLWTVLRLGWTAVRLLGNSFIWTKIKLIALNVWTKITAASQWLMGKAFGWTAVKMAAMAVVTKTITAAQWLWNVAMTANPIGLIIAGVAALAVGAVWLYKNFEPFTNLIDGIWEGAKKFFSWISDAFSAVGEWFSSVGDFFGMDSETENKLGDLTEKLKQANQQNITLGTGTNLKMATIPVAQMPPMVKNAVDGGGVNNRRNVAGNTNYNYGGVNVKVVNPASEIDIQRAVKRSLKDIKRDDFNRSYDEDVSP